VSTGNRTTEEPDPTEPIVRRPWSSWTPYIDKKGLFPKVEPPSAAIPYEPPGTARPAIYELARQNSRGGAREIVYVGKAAGRSQGIRKRLQDHHTLNDALYDRITEAMIKRYELWVRYIQLEPGEASEADRLERELRLRLSPARYPWNAP
jgi:hypothetical protein